jgi:hypothetical protein
MKSALDILAESIAAESLRMLLIGGYALHAYGVARQTADVDCLAPDEVVARLDRALKAAGYNCIAQTENFRRYRSSSVYLMDIDVLSVSSETYNKLSIASQTSLIQNLHFRIPSLLHLIALKLHAIRNNPNREARDLGDIAELIRMNKTQIPPAELREICQKYAPDGWTDRIMGYGS